MMTPGVEVRVLSRRGTPRFDVTDPSTFGALEGSDLVLNVSNSTAAAPDVLAAHCLSHRLVLLEASSDRSVIERLLKLPVDGATGALILGAGIFTGLSNLLAQAAVRKTTRPNSLRLAIATSPYSVAGQGTVDLMVAALETPAIATRHGVAVPQPMALGPQVRFREALRPTVIGALAEQAMLPASTRVPNIEVLLAPKPGFLAFAFARMPGWLVKQRWFKALLRLNFTVLRRLLLAWRSSAVELLVESTGPGGTTTLELSTRDGMKAGGIALAALALEVLTKKVDAGRSFIDERVELQPSLERIEHMSPGLVQLHER